MAVLIGEKMNMQQMFREDGTVVPVTIVHAGPCTVTQVKAEKKDGTNAVQLGFGEKKKASKPIRGHLKDLTLFRTMREFPVDDPTQFSRGQVFTVEAFKEGDSIAITGVSKGRGFQGVVKRHGFHGSPATHGHKDQLRMPGSIGAGGIQRVIKGMRMAGRMGGARTTVRNLIVEKVDTEKNLLYIRGAVPGARKGLITIRHLA
ncbi:MAG: 50S ribosomal protein L3 [Patescibacteria group bacterium]|jgi:large subunit ribosomal protein L3